MLRITLTTVAASWILASQGFAQDDPNENPNAPTVSDDDESEVVMDDAAKQRAAEAQAALDAAAADAPRYGVGLRLRQVFLPQSVIELFLEEAAGGVSQTGFGLDFIRRRGDFEFSVGFEYESLAGTEGFYIENGGSTSTPGTVDDVDFDGFSWLTLDASFMFHKPLTDVVSLRYGGGFGIGLILGDILETDAVCTGSNTQSDCIRNENGAQVNDPQDLPPVFPVVNVSGGVQFRPVDNLLINVEAGIRTVLFAGTSVQYLF